MAGDAEGPGFGIDAGLPGVTAGQIARNEVENLLEGDNVAAGWCWFLHGTLPSGREPELTPSRFPPTKSIEPVGWL